jgi:hypothetical protein
MYVNVQTCKVVKGKKTTDRYLYEFIETFDELCKLCYTASVTERIDNNM